MSNPFPGMDPYIEQRSIWQTFHSSFIAVLRSAINEDLPAQYAATIEQRLALEVNEDGPRSTLVADVSVADTEGFGDDRTDSRLATLAAPEIVSAPQLDERPVEWSIEISDVSSPFRSRVVTLIEALSFANKQPGRDGDFFEAKRNAVVASDVHYVEIDLLRGGRRWPEISLDASYCVAVSLTSDRDQIAVWPCPLRDPLPTIAIPLARDDRPLRISLQQVVNKAYVDERYVSRRIHKGTPDPPLSEPDCAWAEDLLAAAGLR